MSVECTISLIVGARLSDIGHVVEEVAEYETRYHTKSGEPYQCSIGKRITRELIGNRDVTDIDGPWEYCDEFIDHVFGSFMSAPDADHIYFGILVASGEEGGDEETEIKDLSGPKERARVFLKENFGYEGPIHLYLITTYS